jgi:hypothetical protein
METMSRGQNSPSNSSTNTCQIWMRQQKGTSRANAKGSDERNRKLSKKGGRSKDKNRRRILTLLPLPPPTKLNDIFVRVEDLNEEIHINQIGAFPHTSQCGNCYVMVAIHLDTNYIFIEPMKNRAEGEMIRVYQKILNRMKVAGLGLRKQVLNNECSAAMKAYIKENGMEYKLVPPGQHRCNQAERAIQTFKAHFISILAGNNDKFPLSLWCHLPKPTKLTLNLLHQSRVAPQILAFAHVHGTHDYMQKLFALIGCVVKTHVKPNNRLSWDTRSEPGFSLGTSMEHHQCFRVYVTGTRATRISDTVVFKHQYMTSPMISPESHVEAAAQQLVTALQGNIPAGNKTAEALTKVSKLFTKIALAMKDVAKAKEQRIRLWANPLAQITTHLPRVAVPPPRVDVSVPRVTKATQADCCKAQTDMSTSVTRPPVQTLATHSSQPPQANTRPPLSRPNYISQGKEDDDSPPEQQTTRSAAWSIMQKAMLACVDIYRLEYTLSEDLGLLNYTSNPTKPTAKFTVTPQQMSMRCLPMAWFCEMTNSVTGEGSKLLEYMQLIANPKTQAKRPIPMETKLNALPRACQVATPVQTPSSLSGRTRYQ